MKKKRALSGVAALAAASVAIALALGFGDFREPGVGDRPADALQGVDRPNVSGCLEGARDREVTPAELDSAKAALTGLDLPDEGEVVEGCPPSRVLEEDPPRSPEELELLLERAIVGIREPGVPSPHRLFVYLVAPDVYGDYFGTEPWVIAAAEMLCSGHVCGEVTTAVYVPAGVDEGVLGEAMAWALGLREPEAPPTPDLALCLADDRPYWCEQFPE